jgi:hypothetical protein
MRAWKQNDGFHSVAGWPINDGLPLSKTRSPTKRTWRAMAATAQSAAAVEVAATGFDFYNVDGRCRRSETRDIRRRDAAFRWSRRHLTRHVLTGFCLFRPKARKHDDRFGQSTKEENPAKELRKSGWWFFFIVFLCFSILAISRLLTLVFG